MRSLFDMRDNFGDIKILSASANNNSNIKYRGFTFTQVFERLQGNLSAFFALIFLIENEVKSFIDQFVLRKRKRKRRKIKDPKVSLIAILSLTKMICFY